MECDERGRETSGERGLTEAIDGILVKGVVCLRMSGGGLVEADPRKPNSPGLRTNSWNAVLGDRHLNDASFE